MLTTPERKYFVLIADDSEDDSFFFERALRQSRRFTVVGSVRNGEEIIAYLTGQGQYADRQLWPMPDVLMMDLIMPRLSGTAVLEWLHTHQIPGMKTVIISGSALAQDIQRVKELGAAAFYSKSAQHEKLLEMVRNLEEFVMASPSGT